LDRETTPRPGTGPAIPHPPPGSIGAILVGARTCREQSLPPLFPRFAARATVGHAFERARLHRHARKRARQSDRPACRACPFPFVATIDPAGTLSTSWIDMRRVFLNFCPQSAGRRTI